MQPYLLVGLFAVALATFAYGPLGESTAVADPPAPPAAVPVQGQPPAPGGQAALPLDEPLRLLAAAQQTYDRVQDYTCTLIKQERVKGQLGAENVIQLSFRKQPFSVYMKWAAPRQFAGQEVAYVQGRNNNMMRVHASGLLGAVGWVSIAPNDPRALEHSRHTITETGIGNMIERFRTDWTRDRQANKTQVRTGEFEYAGRRCTRVEAVRLERPAQAYCYRVVVYFDRETSLPIRAECYDWPRQGGPQEGELLESFSYVNLQFNRGLNDAVFNR
jgi:hypothetical protein